MNAAKFRPIIYATTETFRVLAFVYGKLNLNERTENYRAVR